MKDVCTWLLVATVQVQVCIMLKTSHFPEGWYCSILLSPSQAILEGLHSSPRHTSASTSESSLRGAGREAALRALRLLRLFVFCAAQQRQRLLLVLNPVSKNKAKWLAVWVRGMLGMKEGINVLIVSSTLKIKQLASTAA